MGFLKGLWALIQAAPALWLLFKEISEIVQWAKEEIDSRQRIEKLKNAMEYARKTKNTSKIEEIFRGK